MRVMVDRNCAKPWGKVHLGSHVASGRGILSYKTQSCELLHIIFEPELDSLYPVILDRISGFYFYFGCGLLILTLPFTNYALSVALISPPKL